MRKVNQPIWSYAEPGLAESRSSNELQSWLRENGFAIRADVAGMPTAFVASYGSGKPVIAFLAEYDALLGLLAPAEFVWIIRRPYPSGLSRVFRAG